MKTPRILLSPEDMALLRALHRKSENDRVEYMLMGGASKHGADFIVHTLVFPNQEVSIGLVEAKGAPTWLKDIQGSFPVWIHTHLCQAFWSPTDEKTIENLIPSTKDDGKLRVTLSIVLGRDRYLGRVDIHSPVEATLDGLEVCELRDTKADEQADRRLGGLSFGKYTKAPIYGGNHPWKRFNMEDYEEEGAWRRDMRDKGYLV